MHGVDWRLLAYSFVMTVRSYDFIAWHRFAYRYLMRYVKAFPVPLSLTTPQTLTIVRFLNGSNCSLRVIPNRACAERSCESILKWHLWFQTKLNSTQSNYHHHLKYYCELLFQFTSFIFRIVFYSIFRGRKNGGSMDLVHGPGPYFDGPGPWTGGPCFVLSSIYTDSRHPRSSLQQ